MIVLEHKSPQHVQFHLSENLVITNDDEVTPDTGQASENHAESNHTVPGKTQSDNSGDTGCNANANNGANGKDCTTNSQTSCNIKHLQNCDNCWQADMLKKHEEQAEKVKNGRVQVRIIPADFEPCEKCECCGAHLQSDISDSTCGGHSSDGGLTDKEREASSDGANSETKNGKPVKPRTLNIDLNAGGKDISAVSSCESDADTTPNTPVGQKVRLFYF